MRTLQILVVDDDPDFAESLAEVLEARGHQVEWAFSGEEAVQKFVQQEFDVTLMDVAMPGMNGAEAFFEIRKLKPDARVIMMTAFSVEHLLEQAVDKGAVGVLHKPIDPDELFSLLARAMPDGIILVVDDDPDFADSTRQLLEERGHVVLVARNGEEALDSMEDGGIGLLILDLRLPMLSGLEVYLELKRRGRVVPTLIVTGYAGEEAGALEQLSSLEVEGYLKKPFAPEKLFEVIDAFNAKDG